MATLRSATASRFLRSVTAGVFSSVNTDSILSRAVARWRAGNYSSTLDALIDESGNGLHARLGSAVGADSNDPKRLLLSDGGKRLYFPGVAGNNLTSPVIAATSGLFSFRFFMRGDNAAANPYFHYNHDGTEMSLRLLASGAVRFTRGTTNDSSAISGIATTGAWVRVDYNTATGAVNHYTSTDGSNWNANGSGSVSSGAVTSTAHVIGLLGASLLDGFVTRFQIFVDSVQVAGFNAATLAEPYATVADEVSGTWTLNRSASGRKLCVVERDLLLLGTDDYLEVADSPLLDFSSLARGTAVILLRQYGTSTGFRRLLSKRDAAGGNGYELLNRNSGLAFNFLTAGTSAVETASINQTAGNFQLLAGQLDIPGSAIRAYLAAFSADTAASIGTIENSTVLRIGTTAGTPATFNDLEFAGAAIFRESLSLTELARLKQEMLS